MENAGIAWMVFLWNFNQPVCDLVHHGQSVVESTSLQGFPSEIRHHRRYRDGRFAVSKGMCNKFGRAVGVIDIMTCDKVLAID